MKVDKLKDFIERVAWTAIQAAAATVLVALTSPDMTWENGVKLVGIAAALAACKVIAAQQVGENGSGDAIPGGVQS